MTKSIEVTIALMLLFLFILSASQISQNKRLTITQNTKDYIYLKMQEPGFRELVDEKDVNSVYEVMFPNVDMLFFVKICDHIGDDCVSNNNEYLEYKNLRNINYYLADINKTTTIIFGYE